MGEFFYNHALRKTFVSMTQNVVVIKDKLYKNKKFLQVSFALKMYIPYRLIPERCNTSNSDCLWGMIVERLTLELCIDYA